MPLEISSVIPVSRQVGVVGGHLEIQSWVTGSNQVVVDVSTRTSNMAAGACSGPHPDIIGVIETQIRRFPELDLWPVGPNVPGNPQAGRSMTRLARHAIGGQPLLMAGFSPGNWRQSVTVEAGDGLVSRLLVPQGPNHPSRPLVQQDRIGPGMFVSLDPVTVRTGPTWSAAVAAVAIGRRTRIGSDVMGDILGQHGSGRGRKDRNRQRNHPRLVAGVVGIPVHLDFRLKQGIASSDENPIDTLRVNAC